MAELKRAASAIQFQVERDLAPIWMVVATLRVFSSIGEAPADFWPVSLVKDVGTPGALSIHAAEHGIPYAKIMLTDDWTQTVSHEILEMLTNPQGDRMVSASSIRRGVRHKVQYLIQVCDACALISYAIDGIKVADFCRPEFYQPGASVKTGFSFTGAIKKPLQILEGGYLAWHDPKTSHWWQMRWFDKKPTFQDLGAAADEDPRHRRGDSSVAASAPREVTGQQRVVQAQVQAVRDIRYWRAEISKLIEEFG